MLRIFGDMFYKFANNLFLGIINTLIELIKTNLHLNSVSIRSSQSVFVQSSNIQVVSSKMLLKVLILYLVYLSSLECTLHSKPFDYIGNQMSIDDYKELDICESKVCMDDAERFRSYASLNNDSDPCVDFRNFACGNFDELYNETYHHDKQTGFESDMKLQYYRNMKDILEQEIQPDEPEIFKVTKTFYKKCVSLGKFCSS